MDVRILAVGNSRSAGARARAKVYNSANTVFTQKGGPLGLVASFFYKARKGFIYETKRGWTLCLRLRGVVLKAVISVRGVIH